MKTMQKNCVPQDDDDNGRGATVFMMLSSVFYIIIIIPNNSELIIERVDLIGGITTIKCQSYSVVRLLHLK